MNISEMRANRAADKSWFCIEFYDETIDHHSLSAAYTTEEEASQILQRADALAPRSMHIYYWKADGKPVADPPEGYHEGPLAKRGK